MNLKRLWATTATIFALSVLDPLSSGVWAATRAMCPEGWEWNRNSLGQDPCVVVSALDAVCYGNSSYVVPQITDVNNIYAPPKRASSLEVKCNCDTVMYCLWTACASCQDGLIYSWTKWIAECDNGVAVAKYLHNIPQGTAIPHWAFYDVTTVQNQTYDDSIAKRAGRDPEAASGQISPPGQPSGPSNTTDGSGGQTNARVIIGSMVGGVVVAAGVVVLIEQMGSA